MPMRRPDKENLEQEYQQTLNNSAGILLFDYRGLTVEEITELRSKVRAAGGSMRVVRNRMLKRAISDRPYSQLGDLLLGPNCAIFAGDDPVSPAKALVEFAKTHDKIEIRGGAVNDAFLTAAQVDQLSKVPPIEQLYAQILGGVKAPASNILGGVKGLHNKLHGLMKAYCDKLEEAA
ncbi:MAG: 50S ribosomal protein L10 [Candidatus Omnitrophica bacterium]|nr:50S ribosomal protein L10 [Candidatus Omnitrophota bacterium]